MDDATTQHHLRHLIRGDIERIVPFDDTEVRHRQEALNWIDSGAELCRRRKPDVPPMHLIAYFVVLDGSHLLLVDHRNAQLWLPPGGHVEPGELPSRTVQREIVEELSMQAAFVHAAPMMISISQTVGLTAGHTDVCLWYCVRGDRHADIEYDAREFAGVRWFDCSELPATRIEPNLHRFAAKLKRYDIGA